MPVRVTRLNPGDGCMVEVMPKTSKGQAEKWQKEHIAKGRAQSDVVPLRGKSQDYSRGIPKRVKASRDAAAKAIGKFLSGVAKLPTQGAFFDTRVQMKDGMPKTIVVHIPHCAKDEDYDRFAAKIETVAKKSGIYRWMYFDGTDYGPFSYDEANAPECRERGYHFYDKKKTKKAPKRPCAGARAKVTKKNGVRGLVARALK